MTKVSTEKVVFKTIEKRLANYGICFVFWHSSKSHFWKRIPVNGTCVARASFLVSTAGFLSAWCNHRYTGNCRGNWLDLFMKAGKHQSWKQRCCSLCWNSAPWPRTILCFCSQIVTEYINAMSLLVSKFKMIRMLLIMKVVRGQVQKSSQKHVIKESNGYHNRSTLITAA